MHRCGRRVAGAGALVVLYRVRAPDQHGRSGVSDDASAWVRTTQGIKPKLVRTRLLIHRFGVRVPGGQPLNSC
jgi:hypothetical protein